MFAGPKVLRIWFYLYVWAWPTVHGAQDSIVITIRELVIRTPHLSLIKDPHPVYGGLRRASLLAVSDGTVSFQTLSQCHDSSCGRFREGSLGGVLGDLRPNFGLGLEEIMFCVM